MARILLVEDHDIVRRFLCDAAMSLGHELDCVKNKQDGEAALDGAKYDLVIANIYLPDGRGTELATRAEASGAKVLLMTGHPDANEALLIRQIVHLRKPFSLDAFADLIRNHLGA